MREVLSVIVAKPQKSDGSAATTGPSAPSAST